MKRTLALAAAFLMLGPTCASAANWARAGQTQYDADSAYIGATDGLLYFTVCMEDDCASSGADPMVMYMRYDCDAGTESNMEAFSDHWIAPATRTGELESLLCAKRASLPRHQ